MNARHAEPVASLRADAGPYLPRGSGGPVDWTWCIELDQPFDALLEVAAALARGPQRPDEEAETGGLLLNLHLVVCGLAQIVGDHLHRGFVDLTRVGLGGRGGRLLERASSMQWRVHGRSAAVRQRRLARREQELLGLARSLAVDVLAGRRAPRADAVAAVRRLRSARWPAAVREGRLVIPSCFRGHDLYPADCDLWAARASPGEPGVPVLIVGLGAAGPYVGTLLAAALERLGHEHVDLVVLRPGGPLLPAEVRRIRRAAAAGAWVLLADDPWNEARVARVAAFLAGFGVPAERTCVLERAAPDPAPGGLCDVAGTPAARSEDAAPFSGFAGLRRARLEPDEWHVHALLDDDAVERWLNRPSVLEHLGADGAAVLAGHRFPPGGGPPGGRAAGANGPGAGEGAALDAQPRLRRAHTLKVFEVELWRDGERWLETVLGRGVGLGFLGYHSWLVAACLGDRIPDVLGIDHGILYLRWEPGQGPPDPVELDELDEIAAYVAARARRLGLGTGPERGDDGGTCSGADQVARLLARSMARSGDIGRQRVAELLAKHVVAPRRCAVDARMGPSEWVRSGQGLLKVDFEEHGFDATEPHVTDALYDLAAATVGFRLEPDEERQLVEAYVRLTGDERDLGARLFVHKLLAGWAELEAVVALRLDLGRPSGRAAYAREVAIRETVLTRTVNQYLATALLSGAEQVPNESGPVWLVDLEGVLETDRLGFASTSPAGVLALRALRAHGQQVYLAAGRSLGEVRERCRTFGLAGGIAEDGAVAWDARRGEAVTLVGADARRDLARVRDALVAGADVMADPRFQHSLRLYGESGGVRRGVSGELVRSTIARLGLGGLEAIEGPWHTVVRPVTVDRMEAFERLRGSMSPEARLAPLHVVGGPAADVRILGAADGRHVTRNAGPEIRSLVARLPARLTSRPDQAGLLEVVGRTLHRRSPSCRVCAGAALTDADAALVEVLGVQDRGRSGRLRFLLHRSTLRALEV